MVVFTAIPAAHPPYSYLSRPYSEVAVDVLRSFLPHTTYRKMASVATTPNLYLLYLSHSSSIMRYGFFSDEMNRLSILVVTG